MLGEGKSKQLVITMVVVGVVLAGGLVVTELFKKEPPPRTAVAAGAHSKTTKSAARPEPRRSSSGRGHASPGRTLKRAPYATIETGDDDRGYVARVTSINTAVRSFTLKGAKYRSPIGQRYDRVKGKPIDIVTTDQPEYLPFAFELGGVDVPEDAEWQVERLSPSAARFTWEGHGFTVVRKIEAGRGPYQLWSTWRVTNHGDGARPVRLSITTDHYVKRSQESGGFFAARSPGVSHVLCQHGDSVERIDREDSLPGMRFNRDVRFAGVSNLYFANVVAPHGMEAEACRLQSSDRGGTHDSPNGTLMTATLIYPRVQIPPHGTRTFRALGYLGPKVPSHLRIAGHSLPNVEDLGFFSVIARALVALLGTIHGVVGNWGLAIILLTLLAKIVLYPLTEKTFRSMARMRQLKPEIDKLNEVYKDDREKRGAAMMELYRKHKINPVGGCLPQLLQLPIWFALYTSLSTNVELFHSPFVTPWTDLSAPDPFFSLPLALGALMILQQKITPTTMDPVQAKMMMYVMPIMFTGMMLFLPSGLCLYMLTNSALGIAQQKWIDSRLKRSAAKLTPEPVAATAPAAAAEVLADSSPTAQRSSTRIKPRNKPGRARRGRA